VAGDPLAEIVAREHDPELRHLSADSPSRASGRPHERPPESFRGPGGGTARAFPSAMSDFDRALATSRWLRKTGFVVDARRELARAERWVDGQSMRRLRLHGALLWLSLVTLDLRGAFGEARKLFVEARR
jgi:hypothetical protein